MHLRQGRTPARHWPSKQECPLKERGIPNRDIIGRLDSEWRRNSGGEELRKLEKFSHKLLRSFAPHPGFNPGANAKSPDGQGRHPPLMENNVGRRALQKFFVRNIK